MMHLNTYGLMQRGFKIVGMYEAYTKGQKRLNVECYSNGHEFLVRRWRRGERVWDNLFTDRHEANKEVKWLLSRESFYKRTF